MTHQVVQPCPGTVFRILSCGCFAKAAADPAGHYAKRDATRLLLNRKKQRPVVAFDDAPGWEDASELATVRQSPMEEAAE